MSERCRFCCKSRLRDATSPTGTCLPGVGMHGSNAVLRMPVRYKNGSKNASQPLSTGSLNRFMVNSMHFTTAEDSDGDERDF
jgi:hypothetical protein